MDHRVMLKLAHDPDRIRKIAAAVLQQMPNGLPEGGYPFLEDLRTFDGTKPLSVRQLEFLYALIQLSTRSEKAGPYRAATLIRRAWEARAELTDGDDEDWLQALHAQGAAAALSHGQWRRLLGLCRQLDLIDPEEWVPLPGSQLL